MKKAGILGGMGPQATVYFYARFIDICNKKYDSVYPNILINSIETWKNVSLINNRVALLSHLIEEADKLKPSVDFMAIVCNTMHIVIEELREHVGIPVLAIHEVVCNHVFAANKKKIGLLGTIATLENRFYQQHLHDLGIEIETADPETEHKLDNLIFHKVLKGQGNTEVENLLTETINKFKSAGCDGVILACTELPLFVNPAKFDIQIFASTDILAEEVAAYIFNQHSK